LRAGRIDAFADYVEVAGRTAEHASDYLEDRALDEMLDDLGDLAKDHPVAVFAGMLVTGFAAGRVVKILLESATSAEDEDEQSEEEEDEDAADEDQDAGDEDERADESDEDEEEDEED